VDAQVVDPVVEPPDAAAPEPDAGPSANGSATTGPVVDPPLELPEGVFALFPAPGATGQCPDPTLHLHFDEPVTLGVAGRISIFELSSPETPSVVIDLAQPTTADTIYGKTFTLPRPAYVDGTEVIFTLPSRGLGYGKTFFVTIEPGALRTAQGADFTISEPTTWQFSTRDQAPVETTALRVALDGDGDFCTLQGAIDASGDDTELSIGPGNYYGLVYFTDKHGLVLRGDDRELVALKGVNNDDLNPGTRARALIGTEDSSGLVFENLSIENLTPQGGSQAEALTLLGCDQCLVRDVNLLSRQDTLLWQGRIYADNCYVAGNVDYVWGTGAVYFDGCEFRTVERNGYIVQARNAPEGRGYVFVDCKLSSDASVSGDLLARIDVSEYPGSEVAFIDCELGPHIAREGWAITGGAAGSALRFVEYASRDEAGNPIDTSQRAAGSRRLSADEAAVYRDPAQVLGGWTPPGR
jgi:pectin methylesterase-like acyl-CoA thioesterase